MISFIYNLVFFEKKEKKMVRHVVMWRFKDAALGKTKSENMTVVRDALYSLVGVIPEIKRMEIGFDFSCTEASMDFMLLTEFDTAEDLKIYAVHPEHLKVAEYVRAVVDSRVVVDSEF